MTHRVFKSHKSRMGIYVIMKTMCPLGYHQNGFMATHALGHMMYGYKLLVPMNQRVPKSWALFSWLHIYYAHLAFVRFEHSVCCRSLITTYIYINIYYVYIIYYIDKLCDHLALCITMMNLNSSVPYCF